MRGIIVQRRPRVGLQSGTKMERKNSGIRTRLRRGGRTASVPVLGLQRMESARAKNGRQKKERGGEVA